MPPTFKHIVRPDGSIRVAGAGGSAIVPEEGELLVEDVQLRQPGMWEYDFDLKRLLQVPSEVLASRRSAVLAAERSRDNAETARIKALLRKIDEQPAALQEILPEMVDLMGLQTRLGQLKAKKKKP